ncbi:MAG: type I restriction-modification system subunit M N-terminal domain-containing protein, partial [Clostridia bacterium]|nr:type I restriction-modification system subunit M N-terminal domain-containing protein [Clostridia bacterium]
MADTKMNQEREELFRKIYKIATDLVHAGHVSEWDFKSYVLGTMFYRYISESFAAYIHKGEHAAGNKDFDYAKMSDAEAEGARAGLIQEKGFFILPSELFCNVRARADKDENLNETLERVFKNIESSAATGAAESDFAGLFDDFDVNAKAIGETVAKRNKVLVALLNGVAQMPLFSNDGINADMFGDAYEYLMGMYAANAGKKGGQYFTPADVSELLSRLGTIGKT